MGNPIRRGVRPYGVGITAYQADRQAWCEKLAQRPGSGDYEVLPANARYQPPSSRERSISGLVATIRAITPHYLQPAERRTHGLPLPLAIDTVLTHDLFAPQHQHPDTRFTPFDQAMAFPYPRFDAFLRALQLWRGYPAQQETFIENATGPVLYTLAAACRAGYGDVVSVDTPQTVARLNFQSRRVGSSHLSFRPSTDPLTGHVVVWTHPAPWGEGGGEKREHDLRWLSPAYLTRHVVIGGDLIIQTESSGSIFDIHDVSRAPGRWGLVDFSLGQPLVPGGTSLGFYTLWTWWHRLA
ncbi:MAG: hypothetical protein HYV02_01140 [Deltaproteobacteria bacterium]|nr:hypothetical protein [Deltaproteobacteria bacterium]